MSANRAASATADGPATILEGNHPDEAADIVGAAAVSPSQPLAMRLTMAIRNRDELAKLLADQQDPASPQYHRWLTPDAFTSRFGPTDADLARVTQWLKKKGFTVNSADASTREVSFSGSVAQAQNVFGVKIAATTDGRLYSNTSDPAVPAELAPDGRIDPRPRQPAAQQAAGTSRVEAGVGRDFARVGRQRRGAGLRSSRHLYLLR